MAGVYLRGLCARSSRTRPAIWRFRRGARNPRQRGRSTGRHGRGRGLWRWGGVGGWRERGGGRRRGRGFRQGGAWRGCWEGGGRVFGGLSMFSRYMMSRREWTYFCLVGSCVRPAADGHCLGLDRESRGSHLLGCDRVQRRWTIARGKAQAGLGRGDASGGLDCEVSTQFPVGRGRRCKCYDIVVVGGELSARQACALAHGSFMRILHFPQSLELNQMIRAEGCIRQRR